MNLGDLHKVWEIKPLKKKVGEDEARKILERIAKQVQPIMRKHKWRVKLLSEFCPNNPALLGLNVGGGLQVKLRLRRHNRDWDFFPFDQVLDTMLHELCHNAHGPHNASFYKLWDELRKECEELLTKGITGSGEGFDVPGRRLGGFTRQPPLSSLRQTALAAAEKRSRVGSLLPSGPKRLGGDNSIMVALTPVQAAAMAAERRLQDDIWCGSQFYDSSVEGEDNIDSLKNSVYTGQSDGNSSIHSGLDANCSDAMSRKRNRESNNNRFSESDFVDLTAGTSVSGSISLDDSIPQKRSSGTDKRPLSQSLDNHPKSNIVDIEESSMWECVICTLLNPPLAPICKLCSTERPGDVRCKYKIWSCKFCTLENGVDLDKCTACGQWRYSHGPPVATPSPNIGT